MSAAKRRPAPHEQPAGRPSSERQAVLNRDFRRDLTFWIEIDPRIALRVMRLVEDVLRDPFRGTGKPELLKHDLQGRWSRRITDEHRIVYEVNPSAVLFMLARYQYRG
jgi:toxin YoeB